MDSLPERLRQACNGQPATIAWPHRILHEAASELDRLGAQVEAMRRDLAEAREQLTSRLEGNTRLALRAERAEAEVAALKHDIERQITSEQATEIEALRQQIACECVRRDSGGRSLCIAAPEAKG